MAPTDPSRVTARIHLVASEVRSSDAIVVVGAGLSRGPGFPMTAGLRPLLWQALDGDPHGRQILAKRLGIADADAKLLIGDDDQRTTAGFAVIAERPQARRIFQHSFARLDDDREREASPAHDALAELVHRGTVSYVVSLNWDSALERAHERHYGRRLLPGRDPFAKPHGDAQQPDLPWVLPNEPGRLPPELAARLCGLADERPRVLLIVGYSEGDEGIVHDLISPLERQWRVVRIGPSATGQLDIRLPADEAMPRLLDCMQLPDEGPGWEWVTFHPQRGIGPAILGERLGPHDVDACPVLPEVGEIERLLPIAGSVIVAGPSGSGKSISAYQAARSQAEQGWEVIRLVEPSGPTPVIVAALARLRHQTLAVVDDAQSLPPGLVQGILGSATPAGPRVLVVTTDETGPATVVRIPAKQSVEQLAGSIAVRRNEVLPILRELDPWIGDAPLNVSFEDRVAEAKRQDTPWQFSFVLRGGWREARSAVASLRDVDRADLCLAALSVAQLVTADAGVDTAALERLSAPLGRTTNWLATSLAALRARHRVVEGPTLRTPHARFAEVALEVVFEDGADPERPRLFEMIRAALRGADGDPPTLVGVYWLVEGLTYVHGLRWQHDGLVDAPLVDWLVDRFRRAETGRDRGAAAAALNLLRRWNPRATEVIRADPAWITGWLAEVDAPASYGLAKLLNDLINDDRSFARRICEPVPLAPIVERVLSAAPTELYGWAEFLGRYSVASPEKREALAGLFDEQRLDALFRRSVHAEPHAASKLLSAISGFGRGTTLRIINVHARTFAGLINQSPAAGFQTVQDVLWWVLGYAPRIFTRRGPDREGRRVGRQIAALIQPRLVAAAIETARPRDWQNLSGTLFFVHHALPAAYQAILRSIDVDRLDAATAGLWSATPFDLEELLNMVGWGRDHEPARTLIKRHEDELDHLPTRLAVFAPEVISRRVRAGQPLPLGVHNGWDWELAAAAIDALDLADAGLAELICVQNAAAIATGLSSLQRGESLAAATLVEAMRRTIPAEVSRIVATLDLDRTVETWGKLYSGSSDRRGVASLVRLVREEPTAGLQIAERLGARFPSLRAANAVAPGSRREGAQRSTLT